MRQLDNILGVWPLCEHCMATTMDDDDDLLNKFSVRQIVIDDRLRYNGQMNICTFRRNINFDLEFIGNLWFIYFVS